MSDQIARPKFEADHVSWTVADADAVAAFYKEVFGAEELFRMGPMDAADIPAGEDGRDWMESHVNVAGAKLTLIMLKLTETLNFQLAQYDKPADRRTELPRNCDAGGHHLGLRVADVPATIAYLEANGCKAMETIDITEGPLAGKKNVYVLDPFGHQLEIVD
ncbi:glyoxalase [Pacificimonas flava]|uniref:Glyoxalase n=2 Tax=Pacificimonas TaxID=1960290 RepID=A0A219B655_9SPHN|nr:MULTISPECIES: VOC family protein [Pacificimonas]MBZ6379180.1 VOC family protein [Pacificimonas aurantium]OWV33596.1 glyoxalase [Pacificimonas flava]